MAEAEKQEVEQEELDFEIEGEEQEVELKVEDDTPEADRNRSPMPKEIVEDLEKDELDSYSDGVKERFKQMKKVWHDERRAKESAQREQQQAVEMAKKAMEENKKLQEEAKKGREAYLNTAKKSVEYETEMAKRAYKDAYESGDTDSIVDAQTKLSDANFRRQQIESYRPPRQEEENSVNSTSTEAVKPQLDSKTMAWQERNTWYGSDEEMTAAALGFHQKLIRQKGDAYVGSDNYWSDVDNTMRRRFPEYFGEDNSTDGGGKPVRAENKPATVVAPASRSTSSKRIVLKQSQVALAKKLGLTPEQYAKELRRLENQNG
tara:strand:- start:1247 stop:2203 length:957 start_codon:yes stop_codon:yes gene_type:complete